MPIFRRGQSPSEIIRGRDGAHAIAGYFREELVFDGTRPSLVRVPCAMGSGIALEATPSTASIITIPTAAGSGTAFEPVVHVDALITSPAASGSGIALPVTLDVPALVFAPPATGSGEVPTPQPLVVDGILIPIPAATGSGVALEASPVVGADISAPVATGSGFAPVPVPGVSTSTTVPAASGSGQARVPAIQAGLSFTVPTALGSGLSVPPSPVVDASRTVPVATGSGLALPGSIIEEVQIVDTFNRANGAIGSNWVALYGHTPVINTNRAQGGTTGASNASSTYGVRHVTPLATDDQEVTMWIVKPVGTQNYAAGSSAILRMNLANTQRVTAVAAISGTTHTIAIASVDPVNGGVVRASSTAYRIDMLPETTNGPLRMCPTAIRLRAVGNVYTIWLNDAPTTITWTDTGNLISQSNHYWGFEVYTTENASGVATYSNAVAQMEAKDYVPSTPVWETYQWQRPGWGTRLNGWGYYSGSSTTFHNAIDLTTGGTTGRPIRAAADGIVCLAGDASVAGAAYGNGASIWHQGDICTDYAHMLAVPLVSTGEAVTRGQTIGYVGSTGASSTPHLHFGIRRGSVVFSASDPWLLDTQFPYQDPEAFLTRVGVPLNWTVDPGDT